MLLLGQQALRFYNRMKSEAGAAFYMASELGFFHEVIVAAVGGLIAAGGGGYAVYTQLARAELRRNVREQVLDSELTVERERQAESLVFLAEHGHLSQQEQDELGTTIFVLTEASYNDSSDRLRRISAVDRWTIARHWKHVSTHRDARSIHRALVRSRRFLERRLRGTWMPVRGVLAARDFLQPIATAIDEVSASGYLSPLRKIGSQTREENLDES